VNVSVEPGSPLSVTATVKVHGIPFLTHVSPNVPVVSTIENVVNVALCTLGQSRGRRIADRPGSARRVSAAVRSKRKLAIPPGIAIEAPPVIVPRLAAAIFATKAS